MPRRGLGNGVILVGVRKPRSAPGEAGQSTGKLGTESGQVIAAKPVDGDHHDQGRSLGGGGLSGRRFAAKYERGERKKGFRHAAI